MAENLDKKIAGAKSRIPEKPKRPKGKRKPLPKLILEPTEEEEKAYEEALAEEEEGIEYVYGDRPAEKGGDYQYDEFAVFVLPEFVPGISVAGHTFYPVVYPED